MAKSLQRLKAEDDDVGGDADLLLGFRVIGTEHVGGGLMGGDCVSGCAGEEEGGQAEEDGFEDGQGGHEIGIDRDADIGYAEVERVIEIDEEEGENNEDEEEAEEVEEEVSFIYEEVENENESPKENKTKFDPDSVNNNNRNKNKNNNGLCDLQSTREQTFLSPIGIKNSPYASPFTASKARTLTPGNYYLYLPQISSDESVLERDLERERETGSGRERGGETGGGILSGSYSESGVRERGLGLGSESESE